MPISKFVLGNMRMNVSQFFMYELGLKKNSQCHPDKQEIKEIQEISKDSMQCCMNNLKETDVKKLCGEIEIVNDAIPKHNFIPYPDHNYGQQPPLTPPEETAKVEEIEKEVHIKEKPSLSDQHSAENGEEQEGVTRCICGFEHDDGYMICCDNCSSWQHIECMGIKSCKVPEKYSCHKCSPRELDIEGARTIQAKKKENMSEDDDDEDEETCSEDETSNKTMYTAISNTPTRITLLSNTSQQSNQSTLKSKNRRGNKVPKKKLSDQRNTRRKTKKKEKNELLENDLINGDSDLFPDCNTLNDYISAHKLYEEIEENKYDEEIKNMHFKLPEAVPSIDFKNIVKCHRVFDVSRNRKGLIASYNIPCGKFILEYKGTLMSRKKFVDSCNPPIFKNICPYVVNYTKIDHMYLVIDARDYGNDARFVRRSCTPNAELQHITSNGAIHIMIISKVDILQDKEITVPFDFMLDAYKGLVDCACNLEECAIKKQNINVEVNKLVNNTEVINSTLPIPPLPNDINTVKTDLQDENQESENELSSTGEESKQEKLSREERKLQAYMKQFEKLEKKQDIGKKGKEPKTPVSKVTPDENMTPSPMVKPTIPKKVSGGKRKISFTGKRRTRQSSCSSEPVSPTEQDTSSSASTPTTPNVVASNATPLDASHTLSRQRSRKEKEPLTLTLPIQRKLKQEQLLDSPTPPATPVIPILQSPSKSSEQQSSLSLTVDTQLENELLKTSSSNGLLQIVQTPNTEPRAIATCTVGMATSEEKIGDVTSRLCETQPSPVSKPIPNFQREGNLQRKYYGSIKKHWLRQYSQNNLNAANCQSNSSKQICLAALVASLSREHIPSTPSHYPTIKRINSLPLKKRYLVRAAKSKEDIPVCSTNAYPVCRMESNILGKSYMEGCRGDNSNLVGSSASICSPLTHVSAMNDHMNTNISCMPEGRTQERIPLPGNVDNSSGATTKLTYSLMYAPDARTSGYGRDNIRNDLKPSVTALQSILGGNLKTPSDNVYLLTDLNSEVSKEQAYPNSNSLTLQDHRNVSIEDKQSCSLEENPSVLQASIKTRNPLLHSTIGNEINLYQNTAAVNAQLFPLVGNHTSQNVSNCTSSSSELLSSIKITSSPLGFPIVTANPQIHSGIETTYSELLSGITKCNTEPQAFPLKQQVNVVSVQNCVQNIRSNDDTSLSSIPNNKDDIGEPCHKKRCVAPNEENSEMGLKIDMLEPLDTSERSFDTCETSVSSSLLISSQNDLRIQNLTHNSLESNIVCSNTKYITTSICNNLEGNVESNPLVSQESGTGGRKKLSFKEYRNRQRSQKTPSSNLNHLSTTSDHSGQLLPMPVSPAQKINQAAGLLLTPRTVSLRDSDKTALYTNNLDMYMPINSQNSPEVEVSAIVTNGVTPTLDASKAICSRVATTESSSISTVHMKDLYLESSNDQGKINLVESGSKQLTDLAYRNNTSFEPVSPSNDYDTESPADETVTYMNTIHSDITKNPFSIHNDITKHPFGKKQNQGPGRGSDITEMDDDASSTHSNMSSTSYGSVSEVSHERAYPPHHRIFPRDHNSREYSTREPPREGREYFQNGTHPSFGTHQYYPGYNQIVPQAGVRPSIHRMGGFAPHSNFALPSNQTPRQRQTQRGYIPF